MTEHIRHIEFTNLKCDYSGISIPYGWIVVVVEPVIPRFINGQVDLELPWLDAAGAQATTRSAATSVANLWHSKSRP